MSARDVTYNYFPDESFKLIYQKNKDILLNELKTKLTDTDFEFSYTEIPFKKRLLSFFIKKLRFGLLLKDVLKKYGYYDFDNFYKLISADFFIWKSILKSKLYPSKRFLFKICLYIGINISDNLELFKALKYDYDYRYAFDVVLRYLIEKKVFSRELMKAAFKEYKLKPFDI